MRVSTISARIKASKEVNGCWKTIEFGAEAVLDSGDDWKKSQHQLFADLSSQLKKALNPNRKNPKKPDYPEPPIPTGTRAEKPREKKEKGNPETKMCPIHNVPMKRWTKNGGSWYSHLVDPGDGTEPYWCNGKRKKAKK